MADLSAFTQPDRGFRVQVLGGQVRRL